MNASETAEIILGTDLVKLHLPARARKWRVGMDCGDTFCEGDDFDGWTLLIELDDAAQADAVARALRHRFPHWQPDPDSPGVDHA